jgi:endonuclease YncB( thermonuclease family)
MGLGQWIVIIILVAIIVFGFAAVFDFSKGVIRNVYPTTLEIKDTSGTFIMSKVVKIIDGDTIDLESGERIRLALVNTPERYEHGYQAAKEWTEYRCLGKDALIDLDDNQQKTYGSLVGMVYCDEHNVNWELVSLDLAVVMKNYCKFSEFKDDLLCLLKHE